MRTASIFYNRGENMQTDKQRIEKAKELSTFTTAFSRVAALAAANWVVLESFLSIKLLLAGCKDKIHTTVFTF
jgi:hypothetical protein